MSNVGMGRRDVENWLLSELPGGEIANDHVVSMSVGWWTCECGITRKRINGSQECEGCGCIDLGIHFAEIHEAEQRAMRIS